jgi:hypothetical protein
MPGTIIPIGVGTAVPHPKQATAGAPLDPFVAPGDTNAPIIFEPPAGLTNGAVEVWIIASGGSQWGGCQVWISTDGNTYALAGTTQADADAYVTLCFCGGELVSFETATLTATCKYNLTYLRRGAYGTAIGSHAGGTAFARFGPNDPSLFRYDYPASFVGQSVYVKLPAFNIFGQALQGLAAVSAYSYTLLGTGGQSLNVIAALAAGIAQDWGIVGTSVAARADLASIAAAAGYDIDLGAGV